MAAQDLFREDLRSSKVDFDAFMEDMAMVVTYVAGDETGAMNASRSPASLTPSPSIEGDMNSSFGSRTESPASNATPLSAFNLGAAAIVSSRRAHNSAALLVDMDEIASALNASYDDPIHENPQTTLQQAPMAAPVAAYPPKVMVQPTTSTAPVVEHQHIMTRGSRAAGRSDAPRPVGFPARTSPPALPTGNQSYQPPQASQGNNHNLQTHGGSATWGSPSSSSSFLNSNPSHPSSALESSSSTSSVISSPHDAAPSPPTSRPLPSHPEVTTNPANASNLEHHHQHHHNAGQSPLQYQTGIARPLPTIPTSTGLPHQPAIFNLPSNAGRSSPQYQQILHTPEETKAAINPSLSSLPTNMAPSSMVPKSPLPVKPTLSFPEVPSLNGVDGASSSGGNSPLISPRAIPPGGFVSAFGVRQEGLSTQNPSHLGQGLNHNSSGGFLPPPRPITPPSDGSPDGGRQRTRAAAPMPAGRAYNTFEEVLLMDSQLTLLKALCTCLQVTEATKTCASIVMIFEKKEKVLLMIQQMIEYEVSMQKTAATLFRNNSLTTHMMTCYTKLVGLPFLKTIIGPLVLDAFAAIDEGHVTYEIDPSKLPLSGSGSGSSDSKKQAPIATGSNGEVLTAEQKDMLKQNVSDLKGLVHTFFDRILNSRAVMPKNFMEICHTLQTSTVDRFPESRYFVIGGFLFLRYICPAVVAPDGYKLLTATISDKQRRMLVLVSKILQTIANERTFGEKEQYMMCMNQLVNEYQGMVQYFFNQLAKPVLPDTPDNVPAIVITPEDFSLALKQVLSQVKSSKNKLLQHPLVIADQKLFNSIESLDTLPLQ